MRRLSLTGITTHETGRVMLLSTTRGNAYASRPVLWRVRFAVVGPLGSAPGPYAHHHRRGVGIPAPAQGTPCARAAPKRGQSELTLCVLLGPRRVALSNHLDQKFRNFEVITLKVVQT